MAYFCPVMPVHIAKAFKDRGELGKRHLLLAHDVVKRPKEYADVFQDLPWDKHVILDNSVVELGHAVDVGMIKEAAEICLPTCVVLPDAYQDCEETVKSVGKSIDEWYDKIVRAWPSAMSFMYLPQGKNKHEFAICAEAFGQDSRIQWWGVPRNYCVQDIGSRVEALRICRMVNSMRQTHMFGFSDDFVDDMISANHPDVYSIDSAVPIRAASSNKRFSLGMGPLLAPRGNWWEEADVKDIDKMILNYHIACTYANSIIR